MGPLFLSITTLASLAAQITQFVNIVKEDAPLAIVEYTERQKNIAQSAVMKAAQKFSKHAHPAGRVFLYPKVEGMDHSMAVTLGRCVNLPVISFSKFRHLQKVMF